MITFEEYKGYTQQWYNENKDEIMIFFHEIVEAFFDFVDELISEYKKEK